MTHDLDVARAMAVESCEGCDGIGRVHLGPFKSTGRFIVCQLCMGSGRKARPAYSPESAIGAPDEVDRLKEKNVRLQAQLSDALKQVDQLKQSLLSALNKAGR